MVREYRRILVLAAVIFSLTALSACMTSNQPHVDIPTAENGIPANKNTSTPVQAIKEEKPPPVLDTDESALTISYPIVDTGQKDCYDNLNQVDCLANASSFFGQDAYYNGNEPQYLDNGDGTITDLVTGLMWQKDPGEKKTYQEAVSAAGSFDLAGYDDWRLPSIKELYSLILFTGNDPSGYEGDDTSFLVPYIDPIFDFDYGDPAAGDRIIDSQFASSTLYVSTTMNGAETMFGVNFADGRIKGYPIDPMPIQSEGKKFFVLYVRGSDDYGRNAFTVNNDGTIFDHATGLAWMQSDSGTGMDWQSALAYCENLELAGLDDWRLPNAKELQSIVDYSRSPETTQSGAIDPVFSISAITNEAGQTDYPYFWSSTTHLNTVNGSNAVYISFGRALGFWQGSWTDVHGAGAQRTDPKSGSTSDYPRGHGPQGDAIRIENYVRCVSGGLFGNTESKLSDSENKEMEPTSSAHTNTEAAPEGSGPQSAPPQEAIEACEDRSIQDACQFTNRNNDITGICLLVQEQLACVPDSNP